MSGPDDTGGPDTVPARPVPVAVALGANLGDRAATLRSALRRLQAEAGLTDVRVSAMYETPPVGGPEQGPYLNAVLVARCSLSPRQLLHAGLRVEAEHGRDRSVRWGPRTLDVDVLVHGGTVCADPELTLPHPRARGRGFVLVPWAEVDPDAELPGPDGGRVADLVRTAADAPHARRTDLGW